MPSAFNSASCAFSAAMTASRVMTEFYLSWRLRPNPLLPQAGAAKPNISPTRSWSLACGVNRELGEAYLDQIDQTRTASNLKRKLGRLGLVVSIQPKEAATIA